MQSRELSRVENLAEFGWVRRRDHWRGLDLLISWIAEIRRAYIGKLRFRDRNLALPNLEEQVDGYRIMVSAPGLSCLVQSRYKEWTHEAGDGRLKSSVFLVVADSGVWESALHVRVYDSKPGHMAKSHLSRCKSEWQVCTLVGSGCLHVNNISPAGNQLAHKLQRKSLEGRTFFVDMWFVTVQLRNAPHVQSTRRPSSMH